MKTLRETLSMNEAYYELLNVSVQMALDTVASYFKKLYDSGVDQEDIEVEVMHFEKDLDARFKGKYAKLGKIIIDGLRDY